MQFIESSKIKLQANKQKITPMRELILKLFAESKKSISAYQIQKLIGKKANIVTIYRTLETFSTLGIIHFISSKNGYFRCDLTNNSKPKQHAFLVCNSCNNVAEYLHQSECHPAEKIAAIQKNFQCQTHIQETLGLCQTCQ